MLALPVPVSLITAQVQQCQPDGQMVQGLNLLLTSSVLLSPAPQYAISENRLPCHNTVIEWHTSNWLILTLNCFFHQLSVETVNKMQSYSTMISFCVALRRMIYRIKTFTLTWTTAKTAGTTSAARSHPQLVRYRQSLMASHMSSRHACNVKSPISFSDVLNRFLTNKYQNESWLNGGSPRETLQGNSIALLIK